jgi:hypothetical protein
MSSISANGATSILYLQQSGSDIQYKINSNPWTTISSWPLTVNNTNTSTKLKILLETNLVFTSLSHYFIFDNALNVGPIQLGDTYLGSQGERKEITLDSISFYEGLIRNGTNTTAGKSNISVYNLKINGSSSSLQTGSGWFGRARYGRDATANFFINCTSDGDIASGSGGIIGDFGGYRVSASSSSLTLIGCSSTGNIDSNGGGIMATWAGQGTGASVLVAQCYSSGTIGVNAGGIIGTQAANSEGSVTVLKSYSTGNIVGSNAGGIFGAIAGNNNGSTTADTCYSTGNIVSQIGAGGIFGTAAGGTSSIAVATNCYTVGSIDTANGCGGIFGQSLTNGLAQSCYTCGSTTLNTGYIYSDSTTVPSGCYSEAKFGSSGWNTTNAKSALSGAPASQGVGSSWTDLATNTRFELSDFGYTPYQEEVIYNNALIQKYSVDILPGETTKESLLADASGNAFSILETSGGVASSYSKITINRQTGAISTTKDVAPGTYIFKIGSTGSYFITTFSLTISLLANTGQSGDDCCVSGAALKGSSYEVINQYRIGNALVSEQAQNSQQRFVDYAEYVKYKMALGSRKA